MMKRNRFGMNLDEGIPLSTDADFEQLYVVCLGETFERLRSWMEEGQKPLLLGGQIGSGKSTLINKALNETPRNPDIVLHFDRETLNLDVGDFWSITLAGFIGAALAREIDLSFCRLPQELGGFLSHDWNALREALAPEGFSMDSFKVKLDLRKKVADNSEYIGRVVGEIGERLQDSLGRPLFVFAAGMDKFDVSSAAYLSSQDVVTALTEFKTLFEVNAVHLFSRVGAPLHSIDRLFIAAFEKDATVAMLSKRMGVYAGPIHEELRILAEWSGGNPRQAIRLLSHFEIARKHRTRSQAENMAIAVRETASDLFAYSSRPSKHLMKTVMRSASINTSLFSLPGDRDTARLALYGNWIIMKGGGSDASWPAIANPLVKAAFEKDVYPEEPELTLFRSYAARYGMSATGLGLSRLDEVTGKEKSAGRLLWEFFASGVEQLAHTSLSQMLDVLGAALLSKNRADRAIIAYKFPEAAQAARAYLFAKANSYEYQRCEHWIIEGGAEKNPLERLSGLLHVDTDIFSFDFLGEWEPAQLETLDRQRDSYLDHQMLWWIPLSNLKTYLPRWTQLRQLFEVFVLEDELLGSLSKEEVEAELAFFKDLTDNGQGAAANVVGNLKIVLEYLHKAREIGKEGRRHA